MYILIMSNIGVPSVRPQDLHVRKVEFISILDNDFRYGNLRLADDSGDFKCGAVAGKKATLFSHAAKQYKHSANSSSRQMFYIGMLLKSVWMPSRGLEKDIE